MNVKWNHRLAELVDDWVFYSKTYSWQSSILTISKQFLVLPCRHIHYLVFARSLLDPLPEIHLDNSLVIRRFLPQDIPEVAAIDRPSEARLCARRLANGHVGVAVVHNDRLAGCAWACTEINPNIERIDIPLKPSDFLCNDDYTSPSFRGRGIQTSLVLERFRIFREMGYRRAICYIDIRNHISQHVYKKLGSCQIGEINFIRIGARRWARISLQPDNSDVL